jgi:hypothetical protein
MTPHLVRWRWLLFTVTGLMAVVLIAQIVNTQVVRNKLCSQTAAASECSAHGGLGTIEAAWRFADPGAVVRTQPAQVDVTTWLFRRTCRGNWTLNFGGRADLSEVVVDAGIGTVQLLNACVSTDGTRWEGLVENARLSIGGCVVRFAPFQFSAHAAAEASVEAAIDPQATAACNSMLSDSMRQGFGTALTGSRLQLTLRYEPSAEASPIADVFTEIIELGDLSRALTRIKTSHRLDVTLADGDASLRIETEPVGEAVGVHLMMQASEAIAALMPADVRPTSGPLALDLRWDLDHASGVVRVNGQDWRRRSGGPVRSAGLLALPSSECGSAGPAPRSLYFVEANDRGEALLPSQADAAFAALDAAMRNAGALVTVFVHGWQRSAAPGDSYVCRFADIIASVEDMESRAAALSRRPARRVIGIYVGWPGALYENDLANAATTFWNRLHAADSLGGPGGVVRPLLAGLAQRVASGRTETRADRRSSLVVVGHSMGARAVFNALRQDLLAQTNGSAPDMTLLVNPAFSAEHYRAVHERARDCTPGMAPLLLFSSEADAVTRQLYPAGQTVTYASATKEPAPFLEHIYTAANFGEFVTHRLALELVNGSAPEPEGQQTILRGFERVPTGSRELYSDNPVVVYRQPATGRPHRDDVWYRLQLSPLPGTFACDATSTRSAVIAVDPQVLPDHGRIFTPSFVEYITRVLNAQSSEAQSRR